jgi:hypothetical protein
MSKVNKSLLIPQQIMHVTWQKFHDEVWNILPHHILIPHGKQIYWDIP